MSIMHKSEHTTATHSSIILPAINKGHRSSVGQIGSHIKSSGTLNVPETFVLPRLRVPGSNVGIIKLQHVLASVHSTADTPAPPNATTARPIITVHSQDQRCDDARAPRGHNPPPARSTETTPTPPTPPIVTIDNSVDQKRRYRGRRTTTTTRPFSSYSLSSSRSSTCSRSLQPPLNPPPPLLVSATAAPLPGRGRGDGGTGSDVVPTLAVTPGPAPSPDQIAASAAVVVIVVLSSDFVVLPPSPTQLLPPLNCSWPGGSPIKTTTTTPRFPSTPVPGGDKWWESGARERAWAVGDPVKAGHATPGPLSSGLRRRRVFALLSDSSPAISWLFGKASSAIWIESANARAS